MNNKQLQVSTVLSGTIRSASKACNQKWWGWWRGHLTSTSASSGGSLELGCVRKYQAAGTRCGVPEHYHCTALLYSTVTTVTDPSDRRKGIIIFTLMASCDKKSLDILVVQFCAPNQFSNSLHSNPWPGRAELSRTRGTRGDPGQREPYYMIKLPTFYVCTCWHWMLPVICVQLQPPSRCRHKAARG